VVGVVGTGAGDGVVAVAVAVVVAGTEAGEGVVVVAVTVLVAVVVCSVSLVLLAVEGLKRAWEVEFAVELQQAEKLGVHLSELVRWGGTEHLQQGHAEMKAVDELG
jgi:bifunctional ADP-heptose synthase (sugar kinase/adenylyltransferase)